MPLASPLMSDHGGSAEEDNGEEDEQAEVGAPPSQMSPAGSSSQHASEPATVERPGNSARLTQWVNKAATTIFGAASTGRGED